MNYTNYMDLVLSEMNYQEKKNYSMSIFCCSILFTMIMFLSLLVNFQFNLIFMSPFPTFIFVIIVLIFFCFIGVLISKSKNLMPNMDTNFLTYLDLSMMAQ